MRDLNRCSMNSYMSVINMSSTKCSVQELKISLVCVLVPSPLNHITSVPLQREFF